MSPNKQDMPADLAKIHEALWQEITWLHAMWNAFHELYATSESNVELLNQSAPGFFSMCRYVLLRDILLGISRVTDPAQTGKKDNLSLERLANHIDQSTHSQLKAEIEQDLAVAKDRCSFARESRNRVIAHNGLLAILHGPANPLPEITKQKIEEALQIICEIMNKVKRYFVHTEHNGAHTRGQGGSFL